MLNSFLEFLFPHDCQPICFFCVFCCLLGFESILEGIYGQLLLRDLNLFDGKLVFVPGNGVDQICHPAMCKFAAVKFVRLCSFSNW